MKPNRFLLPSALLSTWLVQSPVKQEKQRALSAVGCLALLSEAAEPACPESLTVCKWQGGANPGLPRHEVFNSPTRPQTHFVDEDGFKLIFLLLSLLPKC